MQHGIHHEGKAVSDCDGESKNTDSEEGMRPQPLHPGRDGAGFRRACSHSRGVFSLAHDEHKAAHQHAGPEARPDQSPDGEARFFAALQSKLRLKAHGVRCVH